jgi:hypothetical protein
MGGIDQFGNFRPGPSLFDPKEKVYYFSQLFDEIGESDENHRMFLPVINLHEFKDEGKKRTKTCYLIGKGTNRREHPEDSIELTRQFASNQEELAKLLNECHTFYCYDTLSAMMEVARLCGCKVKYYGEYLESDLEKYEPGMNGIGCFGHEKKLDSQAFRFHYESMIKEFDRKLDIFLEETQ